jgi:hypothetical protein
VTDRDTLLHLETTLANRSPDDTTGPLTDLLAADFFEHGASGRRWTRDEIIDGLTNSRPEARVEITDFQIHALAEHTVLATYTSTSAAGRARRSSIWTRTDGGWQMLFHQGTPLSESE